MNLNIFQLKSLKTRVTLFTLVIFMVSIWSLAFYASRTLREDLERLLGAQQFSTATLMADSINQELSSRLEALETVAAPVTPALLQRPADVQVVLAQHLILQNLFNGGVFVVAEDGTTVADMPVATGRLGTNYLDNPDIAAMFKDGQSRIGRPTLGRVLNQPVIGLVAPIRDAQGRVRGGFVGMVNLGCPIFWTRSPTTGTGKLAIILWCHPSTV